MCQQCDTQMRVMSTEFDRWLNEYRQCWREGLVRGTPGERVHDIAKVIEHEHESRPDTARCTAWFLSIAVERLMTAETTS